MLLRRVPAEGLHLGVELHAKEIPVAQRVRSNQAKHGLAGAVTYVDEIELRLDETVERCE